MLQEVLKLVPGTNFMGIGNTKSAFVNKFYPMIKEYMAGKVEEEPKDEEFKQYIAKPTVDGLNCRKGPGTNYPVECRIDTDIAITIVEEKKSSDGGSWCKALSGYWVNKKYMKFVRYV